MYFQNGAEFPITPPVEGTQPVEIFEPVVLLPKELYVPWDPTKKSIQYQMTVSQWSLQYCYSLLLHVATLFNKLCSF